MLWVKRGTDRIGNVFSEIGDELFGHKDSVPWLQQSVLIRVLSVVDVFQVQFLDFHPARGSPMIEKYLCLSPRSNPSRHGDGFRHRRILTQAVSAGHGHLCASDGNGLCEALSIYAT